MIPPRKKNTLQKEIAIRYLENLGYEIKRSKGYEAYDFTTKIDGEEQCVSIKYGKILHIDMENLKRMIKSNYNPAFFLMNKEGEFILLLNKNLGGSVK